ncbi:hypothetical protein FQN54_003979 [Arachnomyces sp. PD_36]|nr:hypothetical protein FQN54_003979 [Arachnomyces sp. PD_36]
MAGHRPPRRPQHDSMNNQIQDDSLERRPESGSISYRYSNPNIFSDEFSLEPLDPDDFDRASSSFISAEDSTVHHRNASSASTVSVAVTRNGEILSSPFDDSASVSVEDVSRPHILPKNASPNRTSSVTTNSTNTTTATATTSNTRSVAQRSTSSASHFSIPRALSPYVGETGPSHPYGMYPQGTAVTRSSSVTTTSTTRPSERPLVGPTAPQHPYAMYTQNTVPEETAEDASPIPVGFLGHNQAYQRRPGHGGEDVGDIVGPDGHLEQLPPYSRYPDGIPPKLGMGHASIASAERNSPAENLPPTSPQSQVSSRTLIDPNESQRAAPLPPPSPPDPGDTEESRFDEKPSKRGSARLCCGVPLWMTILIAAVLLIGAVIGGVIGGILGNEKGEQTGGEMAHSMMTAQASSVVVTVTATTYFDATPLSSTPTGLAPVPTGEFIVSSNETSDRSSKCVTDRAYDSAWGCLDKRYLHISVEGRTGAKKVRFERENAEEPLMYGPQAPELEPSAYPMSLMLDKDDIPLGPALFFFTAFDKLVVVPESFFPSSSDAKRSPADESKLFEWQDKDRGLAVPGDEPWFCWWNSTILEVFIYVNQTTVDAQAADMAKQASEAAAGAAVTMEPAATEVPAALRPRAPREDEVQVDWTGQDEEYLELYPNVIKIEEKRSTPTSQQPYCQQMRVMEDGRVTGPVSPVQININEAEPLPTTTYKRSLNQRDAFESNCFCEWFIN